MAKRDRFKKRTSDISGFDGYEHEMVKEKGLWMFPWEKDDPPPSKLSTGGEGDINRGDYFRASTAIFTIDAGFENPTFYITAAGGITPTFSYPYMRVTGSNAAITISANPSIVVGREGNVLTLFCTDSSIRINNGNGVSLVGSLPLLMTSGSVAVFFFNSGNNVWNETSRVSPDIGIGG